MASRPKSYDDVLLQALAGGFSREQAAAKAGVSQRTVYRRLNDPLFRERLAQVRDERNQRTADRISAVSVNVPLMLADLCQATTSPSVRLRAIRTALEYDLRYREFAELSARVATLEEQAKKRRDGEPPAKAA